MTPSPDGKAWPVAWPVLLHFDGQAELGVVRDLDEWQLDPDLYAWPYGEGDRVIDSEGLEYRLTCDGSRGPGVSSLEPTGGRLLPKDVQILAQAHLEAVGAEVAWLEAYLADVPGKSRIRATILYVSKVESSRPESTEDEE